MPTLHALRLGALLLETTTSLLGARIIGLDFIGQYTTAMVIGSFIAVMSDGGAGSRIQAAIGACTHSLSPETRQQIAGRAERAGLILLLSLIALPLVSTSFFAVLLSAGGFLVERRWYLLASRPKAKLALSYMVRPLVLLASLFCLHSVHLAGQIAATWFVAASSVGFALVCCLDIAAATKLGSRKGLRLPRKLLAGFEPRLSLTNALAMSFPLLAVSTLQAFVGATSVGVYSLAYRPVQAGLVLVALQRDLWLARPIPIVGRQLRAAVLRITGACVAFVVMLVVATLIIRPFSLVVPAATNAEYTFVWLALGASLVPGTSFIYAQTIAARVTTRVVLYPTVLAAIVASVAMPFLAIQGGPVGVGAGIALCESVMLASMLVLSRRYL